MGDTLRCWFLHGTTWATKHWPDAYWRALGEIASDAGYRILLPWGDEQEKRRAELIAGGNGRASVLERQTLSVSPSICSRPGA